LRVWLTPLEVPVSVRVEVPVGGSRMVLATTIASGASTDHVRIIKARARAGAKAKPRLGRFAAPRVCARKANKAAAKSSRELMRTSASGGQLWVSVVGTVTEEAVVVTVAVNADATVPFGATEAGEAVQSAKDGAPLQLTTTVPLKPLTGETCRL
jgi:hypothetical protein